MKDMLVWVIFCCWTKDFDIMIVDAMVLLERPPMPSSVRKVMEMAGNGHHLGSNVLVMAHQRASVNLQCCCFVLREACFSS